MSRTRRRRAARLRDNWNDRHLHRWAKAIRRFGPRTAGYKAFAGRASYFTAASEYRQET